jgi:hypothetical protein
MLRNPRAKVSPALVFTSTWTTPSIRDSTGSSMLRIVRVVERTFAWLHNRRRLLVRTDRHDDIHEAFLALACCLICWSRLESSFS